MTTYFALVIIAFLHSDGGAALDTSLRFRTEEMCEEARTKVEGIRTDRIKGPIAATACIHIGATQAR